jgi:hypothetical protein
MQVRPQCGHSCRELATGLGHRPVNVSPQCGQVTGPVP